MANFNRVILAGNMTRDPQLSYTPSNTAVCEFGLAINRKWNDREGNSREETTFVDITAYGRQAEVINQYMSKGRPILVEGRLRYNQWTNKEGQKRSRLDVIVENFTFLGGGGGAGGGGGGGRGRAPERDQGGGDYDDGPPPSEPDGPPADSEIPF